MSWLLAAAALVGGRIAAASDLPDRIADPANWAAQAGDYANQRHSALAQITTDNVHDLQLAWSFSTGVLRGHEGSPLVVGDRMYLHTPFPNKVFALDLDTLEVAWKYTPRQDPAVVPEMCCDTVNRGLAYADGRIFLQQADATLVALDARNGQVLWSASNGDPRVGAVSSSAPHVFDGVVIAGIAGGEWGVRGYLSAYDAASGRPLWRGYSLGPDQDMLMDPERSTTWRDGRVAPVGPDSSLRTWKGDQWKIGGGPTWGWYSYDPALQSVFYGTGNPSTWNPGQRPGDNKWAMSIWSRDLHTGRVNWVYQMTPFDEWDYDGVNEMILADIPVHGRPVPALVHFDRNGFAYTLDRRSGALLLAEKFDPSVNWASRIDPVSGRPVADPRYSTARTGPDETTRGICPASLGSKDQQPASFDADRGWFVVPTNHVCMDEETFEVRYTAGQPYVGASLHMYPAPAAGPTQQSGTLGNVIAWDAGVGRIVWSVPERFSVWSGVLTTAGGLVFYGTLEGWLKALDARTGQELWRFKTPSGIVGNVFSYRHRGRQFIGVFSGIGGWAGIGLADGIADGKDGDGAGAVGAYRELSRYTEAGGVLTVFALPVH
jgi:PQQ-dependent dehydrogenase (methanol/ethanol family)